MAEIRLFLFTLLLLGSAVAGGQVGFGAEAGIGISNMQFIPPSQPVTYHTDAGNPIFAARVSGLADIPMHRHIYFQTGLSLSRKGVNRDFSYYINDSFSETVHQQLALYYAGVPLTVVYKSGIQGKGRLIAGAGCELAYIIGGTNKLDTRQVYRGQLYANATSAKITNNDLALFDAGLHLFAGYELATGWFFKAFYIGGVKDIGIATETDKNRMWGVSAGYIWGKGRNINKEAGDLIDKTDN